MTDREIMRQALAKLEHLWEIGIDAEYKVELMPEIEALRQALAQPEQEPVAWCSLNGRGEIGYFEGRIMVMAGKIGNEHHETPLYTAPPRNPWVGLTQDEKTAICMQAEFSDLTERQMYDVVEAKLRSKNEL